MSTKKTQLHSSEYWKKAPKTAPYQITYNGKKYKAVLLLRDELQLASKRKLLKKQYKFVISRRVYGGQYAFYAR